MSKLVPFVEKYRPSAFENIILDDTNKQIFTNMIRRKYFPNLLFYGPPGTGKTTTIVNIIQEYQKIHETINHTRIIHLNASDDRGIDVVRSQINTFVNTIPLFSVGIKFIILDEIDYMTKIAQQALRCIIQSYNHNVRFCLICNYISKLDDGLKQDFVKIRFNQLPPTQIFTFLKNIAVSENIDLTDSQLVDIQQNFKSDVRSMLNFIQTKQHHKTFILNHDVWDNFIKVITNDTIDDAVNHVFYICKTYNIDKKHMLTHFIHFLITARPKLITTEFMTVAENIIHSPHNMQQTFLRFVVVTIKPFLIL